MNTIQFFREVCHLQDDALLERIASAAVEKTYRPKQCLLQLGKKPEKRWFLVSGVVCSYCMDVGGKEIIDMFISQPGSVSGNILFECLEIFGEKAVDTVTVLEIPSDIFEELFRDYPDMQHMLYEQIKIYAIKYWCLRTMCTNMSLSERVEWFRKVDPLSCEAANNVQLGSFFGASREAISRLTGTAKPEKDTTGMPFYSVLNYVASVFRNETLQEKQTEHFLFMPPSKS